LAGRNEVLEVNTMRCGRNGSRWLAGLGLAALAGCTGGGQGQVELPYRPLDLSAQPAPRAFVPSPTARTSVPGAPTPEWAAKGGRPWKYIVIHHSATDAGNAAVFDEQHRQRGWDELGYHFVIDNGSGGPNGRVEVGSRWESQKWGAHCKTADNEYNNYGIGICLVGDFTRASPTEAQLASLRKLVEYLVRAHNISPEDIVGHCDAPGVTTECPGARLHSHIYQRLRPEVSRALAASR